MTLVNKCDLAKMLMQDTLRNSRSWCTVYYSTEKNNFRKFCVNPRGQYAHNLLGIAGMGMRQGVMKSIINVTTEKRANQVIDCARYLREDGQLDVDAIITFLTSAQQDAQNKVRPLQTINDNIRDLKNNIKRRERRGESFTEIWVEVNKKKVEADRLKENLFPKKR